MSGHVEPGESTDLASSGTAGSGRRETYRVREAYDSHKGLLAPVAGTPAGRVTGAEGQAPGYAGLSLDPENPGREGHGHHSDAFGMRQVEAKVSSRWASDRSQELTGAERSTAARSGRKWQ